MARLRRPLLVGLTALLIAWAGGLVYLTLERFLVGATAVNLKRLAAGGAARAAGAGSPRTSTRARGGDMWTCELCLN